MKDIGAKTSENIWTVVGTTLTTGLGFSTEDEIVRAVAIGAAALIIYGYQQSRGKAKQGANGGRIYDKG